MAKMRKDKGILWKNPHIVMRIFGVVAGCLAFGSVYLTLISALTFEAASLCAVFTGVAVVAVYLALADKKYARLCVLGAAVLYTAVCVAAGFQPFINGAGNFINRVALASNERMHWGFASVPGIRANALANFLFCSVLSVWLGLGSAAICHKSGLWYMIPAAACILLWLFLGLVPAAHAVILLAVSVLLLLIYDRGLTPKAALCYLCAAAVVFGAVSPSLLYGGSESVSGFRSGVNDKVEKLFYGSDDLPNGRLAEASGMRSSYDVRLNVTLSGSMRNLYLRGFVGSSLNGNRWESTDKNAYVTDGYQGMLDYVAAENIPLMQYARYSQLCNQSGELSVTVENVSANRKYVYVPYTLSGYGTGWKNYDMNLLGSIFTSRKYTYNVFAGDKSCERVNQAQWLVNSNVQTSEMQQYVAFEEQYRKFAHDTYGVIDGTLAETVRGAINAPNAAEKINPATNLIRNYFSTNFTYSDRADAVGSDFASDFFGGTVKNANAAYFASAAVLAFRTYGYAARYAEGYLVYADEGQVQVSVTGRFSHAWVEVYFDGIGWLPIEVTPGFYKEALEINPDENPDDTPDDDPEPIKPPEEEPEPVKPPEEPPKPPQIILTPSERRLLTALKVVLPIASVLLAAALTVLGFTINYTVVMRKKRKSLEQRGEAFGRAAYTIAERDYAVIGGFSAEKAETVGISTGVTERFMQIIERCVYGGYDLNENERDYVLRYLESVAEGIFAHGGKWHRFVCKYIKCIGI